ncbi:bifunctional 3-(3-hydroxy-phenyl)propionate/3-hydroxycinnamic acid hydroxylase [Pseudorhodoferax sp.]|uniref:bifunctional 3-(3-hydroxy-phenyl)propionate/3-hydroxycinnamic acid hydroxylase MhpA n=1 Tax=Pseudorhodoferax sp. TaxID=1993553 RepID=UPI0039E6B475
MQQDIPFYDVVQIGYGPVSEIMALALGRQGRRVAVFERWRERYPLPRAVCIDHELYRVLAALGMAGELPAVSHAGSAYRWFNAEWKELLSIDWAAESISGGPEVNFVHQPTLEQMFDDQVRACPGVELHLGWEAVAVSQTADYAELRLRSVDGGAERTVRARYLIGADGANSLVRRTIGSAQQDRGFEADWLVIDVLPHEGVALDIPAAAQWCNPARPTTIVPAGVKDGRYFRRWEFMRLPHETREELEHEAVAWQLLEPWVRPDQATIVRHKVYTFRSLLAERWRDGRLLIAGDAAHVMPPFMGQGMCAGLRDDWNLAWKLALVLDGRADDRLLDSYQRERLPHVSDVIDLSMYLGRIICMPDAARAAERDAAFFGGRAAPPPAFPRLTDGILRRGADGAVQAPAGWLSPHGTVRAGARQGRFDEVVGLGFVLVSRTAAAEAALGAPQRAVLDALGARRVVVTPAGAPAGDGTVQDLDGKFLPFMQQLGIDTMLVRPDFYLYGAVAHGAQAGQLVDDLAVDLRRHGVQLPAPAALREAA